ncbi:MAG: UDP-N-acetylmuramoyl-L-alanine--D-glutamate ligase [Bacteroidia bacterium]|nr:UDP-N-acetylmuramoyl-L-alanine--D-glutamate ligase [Bacteroidia bacterium]
MSYSVGIWGLGESGVGAALLARRKGLTPLLVAEQPLSPVYASRLSEAGLSWEITNEPFNLLQNCTLVVRSPGIRPDNHTLLRLQEKGIPLISDLEWGWQHFPTGSQLWLVTGTTGKTSTTHLLTHLLKTAGRDAIACGNIGRSFCAVLAEEHRYEYYVVEASSFQLWDTYSLIPHLAVITNLSLNHIDWHGSFEAYSHAKLHFVQRLPVTSHLIYDAGSHRLEKALSKYPIAASCWRYRAEKGPGIHAWIENQTLICDMRTPEDPERWEVSYEGTSLMNPAQQKNGLAAAIAARLANLRRSDLRRCFETLETQPHRMEQIAIIDGVMYVNDSKATTTDAVWHAMSSFDRGIVWIAGGVDKGNDWGELMDIVRARVRALVLIGKDVHKLEEAFHGTIPLIVRAYSMEEAVEKAASIARPGEVVLLSPACTSLDWYENYERRGEAFREAVEKVRARNGNAP